MQLGMPLVRLVPVLLPHLCFPRKRCGLTVLVSFRNAPVCIVTVTPSRLQPILQARRREQAMTLMQFCVGVDLEDCIAALVRSGDNPDRAASLLFDPDAVAGLRAERVRVPGLVWSAECVSSESALRL